MKLREVLLLSLSAAFIIIGVHQVMNVGLGKGYWAIMLALIFFFIFNLVRRKS